VTAAWTAVLIGSVLGGGGIGGVIWHAGKLVAILDQLVKMAADHENRIRALERSQPR